MIKKTGIMILLGVGLLLSGCSFTKILQSEEGTTDTGTTVEISGTTVELTGTTTEITGTTTEITGTTVELTGTTTTMSGNTITTSTDIVVNVVEETGTTPQLSAQENALREKIRVMIEERKLAASGAESLTEEDIQLMEDILQQIVDESSQR